LFGGRRDRKPVKSSRKAVRKLFLESLESRQLMAVVAFDDDSFPGFVGNYAPQTHYRVGTDGALTAGAAGDPLAIGLNYLRSNASAFGLTSNDFAEGRYRVTSRSKAPDTGTTSIYLQQVYNGLPVAGAVANLSVLKDGRIMSAGANFVAGLQHAITFPAPSPRVSALEAVSSFASAASIDLETPPQVTAQATGFNKLTVLSDAEISQDPIKAELQYVPLASGGVQLAWRFYARSPGNAHMYDTAVSALGGNVLRVYDGVKNASYNVLPQPVQDPSFGNFSIVVDPHNPVSSPFGWHDINGIAGPEFLDTRGNNVFAQEDVDGNDIGGMRPTGGPTLDFIAPIDFAQAPAFNQFAGLINAFYWVNLAHDVTARHGFDEASGNFQVMNYSGQGFGGDPIILDTQDSLAPNNAFFLPTPEGIPPRLSMGIWTSTLPPRDSSFSADILIHEFFHGVTDRLTGGPFDFSSLNSIQSGGMAEGWSDWFAMLMTSPPSHNANTPRTIGNWSDGQSAAGPGIRRFPYSVDMSINPLVFSDFNGDGIPGLNNSEVHNAGEIWASVLWDMTWALINKYGRSTDLSTGTGGNVLALKLVIDALKLQPNNPSFLEARDAIISADFARTGGENFELLWSVFARRGMGRGAVDGFSADSLAVNAAFDVPPGPARVRGVVFNDSNNSLTRDPNEQPLAGWTIYVDANNNAVFDAGERSTVTQADGSYLLTVFQTGNNIAIRQVVQPNWTQTLPEFNGARRLNLVRGQTFANQNFGNQAVPGEIRGVVFNDLDSDGIRDAGEPGLAGLVVYVDLNNNGRMNLLEYSAITDNFGRYTIKNVPPGTYTVRVAFQPGTVPGATTDHIVTVGANQVLTGIDFPFGQSQFDFGDAPASYGTTRANDGARHGVLAGFHLGALIDFEGDGQPSPTANGDDVNPPPPDPVPVPAPNPDDEDGIVFLTSGFTPSTPATVQVTVNTGASFAGRLHGWIDLNRDGDFTDANEKVISGVTLGTGVHNVTFNVPAGASFGSTFARFRYGFEPNLGPTGPAVAGEVEDYQVNLLANVPIATPDTFSVKQGTIDAPLDVLANDTTTTFGPPSIVPGSFPASLPSGSTLRLNPAGNRILFTPGPFSLGPETFTYRVTDGNSVSAPGQVTVNVTIRDPIAIDDAVIIPFAATPVQTQINVLANDVFPFANTTIIDVQKLTTDPATAPASMQIAAGGSALNFIAPSGFKGTIIYQYTISDADPSTNDATGLLTIQVVDVLAGEPQPAPSHLAELRIQILDPVTGLETSTVDVGDEFLVRVFSDDLRLNGTAADRGVEAVILDLNFNRDLVEPVLDPSNQLGFAITFSPTYDLGRTGVANSPAPGQIDQVGAAHQTGITPGGQLVGVGPARIPVFTIRMLAKATTPAGQPLQIFGNPAEPPGEVLIMSGFANPDPSDPSQLVPIVLADEQVFFVPSKPLAIVGAGEAEFTNYFNPLDVSGDGAVSPIDAVLVINELNSVGGHALSPLDYAASGFVRPTNLLDVNMDSFVAPDDAIEIINYLNAQTALLMSQSAAAAAFAPPSAAGEGESDMLLAGAAANEGDAVLAALMLASSETDAPAVAIDDTTDELPEDQVLRTTAQGTSAATICSLAKAALSASSMGDVDSSAADELFAALAIQPKAASRKSRVAQ